MITSKELLDRTGISRATLNNYIAMDLIPRPEVKRVSPAPGEPPTTLGYFPDWAEARVYEIRQLKQSGMSIDAIRGQLSGKHSVASDRAPATAIQSDKRQQSTVADQHVQSDSQIRSAESTISSLFDADGLEKNNELLKYNNQYIKKELESKTLDLEAAPVVPQRRQASEISPASINSQPGLSVSIDQIDYPAYMINYDSHLIWINDLAKSKFFADGQIPDRAEERSILPALLNWSKSLLSNEEKQELFLAHFEQIKHRLSSQDFAKTTLALDENNRTWLQSLYSNALPAQSKLTNTYAEIGHHQLITINFREGVLIVYLPENQDAENLLNWLSKRDAVIRSLLSKRLPVLTPLAVMVADLQNSVRICSELPPEEYFELINEIWSTLDPIFREYYGAYGKHTGDGMVFYFFPQPDRNYLMDSILCACKIRETMKRISHAWSLKKGWTNQLYMNIGLSEGEEWLGTFKTTSSYELVVLGETINICGRLSDFARFGKIWATKTLVSKLSQSERDLIEYGIQRTGLDQEVFVSNSYAQMGSLLSKEDPRHAKLFEIESYAVTEIRQVKR